MNRQTAEALEASIAHWDANAKAQMPEGVSVSADDCALCDLFYSPFNCKGCPVRCSSGMDGCLGTPYILARAMYLNWGGGLASVAEFHKAAIAERDFLISLREPIDEEAAHSTEAP